MNRRDFFAHSAALGVAPFTLHQNQTPPKMKIAIVGTGVRALGMWGRPVLAEFGDTVEFVGLYDINEGRAHSFQKMLNLNCPVFKGFDQMMQQSKPDWLMVMTVDGTHHEFIIKGMEYGANIITEKPMTIDEEKCEAILQAEKRTGKKIIVTFNYRYSPHRQKIWELLQADTIGKITSVDFHWYLDVYHGADYFRRWHRLRKNSGSLLVHKATHHFDLLNWWIDSDPEEVSALGGQEFYGKNGPYRNSHCRTCTHKTVCPFYFDVLKNTDYTELYVKNEAYDGYTRDGCVFKEDVDIFDKMAVQIKYANKVQVSYSLTTYSPYEGYRISFNGTKGKLDAWIKERQPWEETEGDVIEITTNFGKRERIEISNKEEGHGGGDERLRKQVFSPGPDPFKQAAGSRDGALSCLIGIAARKSIDTGNPVAIGSLTSIKPELKKR